MHSEKYLVIFEEPLTKKIISQDIVKAANWDQIYLSSDLSYLDLLLDHMTIFI